MEISKKLLTEMVFPYAVSIFNCGGREKIVLAAELDGPCLGIWTDTMEHERLWKDKGGTMGICQLDDEGSFLAVQRVYKGFQGRDACIVRVSNQQGEWVCQEYVAMPFIHRFAVVEVSGVKFLVICTLADDKESRDDWSKPGQVYLGRMPEISTQPIQLERLIADIPQNHGMFVGTLQGRRTLLITGSTGVFSVAIPDSADVPWKWEKILDIETSDIAVCDLDGDGQDELMIIEGFHGNKLAIYKNRDGQWKEVYSYPVNFGHAIWGGNILGKPSLLLGYRGANGALLLFQLREIRGEDWIMEITVLDEHEAPTNVAVFGTKEECKIVSCSGGKDRVMLYTLREDAKS